MPPKAWTLLRTSRYVFRAPLVVLAGLETVILAAIPTIAGAVLSGHFSPPNAYIAISYTAPHLVALLAMGLYSRRQRARFVGILLRLMAAIAAGAAVVALQSYLFPLIFIPRPVLLLGSPLAFLILAGVRYGFETLVNEDLLKKRVLVYGAGRRALSISQLRRRTDTRGFLSVGFVLSAGDHPLVPPDRLVEPTTGLLDFCRLHQVDEIVVAMDDRRRSFPVHELLECRMAGISVTDLVDFLETESGKVRLDVLNPSWLIFSSGFSRGPFRQISERSLDVLASVVLLALAWPFMLLAIAAIKLEDGLTAPILYFQVRVGFEGRRFRVVKFRSMRTDAETAGKAIWARQGDPRATRVGGFLRKTRIDELPQLINVIRGDMSFVGPRPERPEFVQELEQTVPYYRERHSVKPGLTGWAQLCYPYGASVQDATEKLQYDLYYVKNHSLLFDLMILLQTVEVILWGKGAR